MWLSTFDSTYAESRHVITQKKLLAAAPVSGAVVRVIMMEPVGKCDIHKNVLLALFVVTNLIIAATLIIDCSPIFTVYQFYQEGNSNQVTQDHVEYLPLTPESTEEEIVEKIEPADWKRHSLEWWENEKLDSTDRNWRGRHQMHDALKIGNLWFGENLEDYFLRKLEENQFPSNCGKNHWIVYQPMTSGLLSCVHVISPVLMMGLAKGDQHTVIPVGYFVDNVTTNPTYDGCGKRKDRHLGCIFNLTSCRIEDDQVRYDALLRKSTSENPTGQLWAEFMNSTTTPGGMSILVNLEPTWPHPLDPDVRIEKDSQKTRIRLWNEVRKYGSVGVYGMPDEAVEQIWENQMEFALTCMISSWMLKQTSARVKEIADEIMAKYSDADGHPFWKGPVLTVHVRQTDKSWEDPFFQKYQRYRNVTDYVSEMMIFERTFSFEWQSIFLISDSGSAIQSLAEALNQVQGQPDSANGEEGKRFIMYDWTDDKDLLERTGGHNYVPQDVKHTAQEHFLATLYIIGKISDYAIVSYSSNVGRFISELIGSRHRLSSVDRVGPNALSIDYQWGHDG